MKIAFDVDDVITEAPTLYAAITDSLVKNKHEVYIISDFDEHFREQRIKELARYGIMYTEFIITADKEEYCKKNGIQFAFDDDPEYYPESHVSKLNVAQMF